MWKSQRGGGIFFGAEISLHHAEPLSYTRAVANNPTVIEKYFELLAETIDTNGLTRRPDQIFNCDETGMPLVLKPPKVVSHVSQKHPYAVTSATILACASASGYIIPPIFDRTRHLLWADRQRLDGYSTFFF